MNNLIKDIGVFSQYNLKGLHQLQRRHSFKILWRRLSLMPVDTQCYLSFTIYMMFDSDNKRQRGCHKSSQRITTLKRILRSLWRQTLAHEQRSVSLCIKVPCDDDKGCQQLLNKSIFYQDTFPKLELSRSRVLICLCLLMDTYLYASELFIN